MWISILLFGCLKSSTKNSPEDSPNVAPSPTGNLPEFPKEEKGALPETHEENSELIWKSEAFQSPESVLYDWKSDRLWVSNIIGNPSEKDGVGRIVELSHTGEVLSESFTSGITLNAPKGMCILDDAMYIADIDTVHVVSSSSGNHRYDVPIPGAMFLNDMACSHNEAYVSDTQTGSIHRIYKEGKAEHVLTFKDTKPNGLSFQGMTLKIVDFGSDRIFTLSPSGEILSTLSLPNGGLDGVVVLRDRSTLVSSWDAQGIFHVSPEDVVTLLFSGLSSPADFSVDLKRNRLLVPQLNDNSIRVLQMPWPNSSL